MPKTNKLACCCTLVLAIKHSCIDSLLSVTSKVCRELLMLVFEVQHGLSAV